MATESITGRTNTSNEFLLTKQVKTANKELGKDQFLNIIMTQLQNQDPTAPLDDATFISQMSQLTNLESMTQMANSFAQTQSYNMIGKGVTGFVSYTNPDTGVTSKREVIGVADSAGVDGGKPYVMIGDEKIWTENITQVFDKSIITGSSQDMLAGTQLVGKYIRADVLDANGQTVSIEGQVQRAQVKDGTVFVIVDGRQVGLFQITEVASSLDQLAEKSAQPETETGVTES